MSEKIMKARLLRKSSLSVLLLILQLQIVGVIGRPEKKCKTPIADVCVQFNPDPDPEEIQPIPLDTDDFWTLPEHRPITLFDQIKFPKQFNAEFTISRLKLFRFFKKADIANVKETFNEAEFELIEWPGRPTNVDLTNPDDDSSFQASISSRFASSDEMFIPFNYRALETKFLGYACNPLQGTHVRALGLRMKPDVVSRSFQDYIPFYLTTGDQSLNLEYTQPLFIFSTDLNILSKDHQNPFCQPIIDGVLNPTSRINHILDFTFTNGRLLIGMYCGIIIVENIDTDAPIFKSAIRNPNPQSFDDNLFLKDTYVKFVDSEIFREQKFEPIRRISASTCCPQEPHCARTRPLAAAYSYDFFTDGSRLKFLYISRNLGNSFDQKLISTEFTGLNLIRNLYEKYAPNEMEPNWVTEEILRLKNDEVWEETDPVVESIVHGDRKATITNTNDSCAEIVSLEVVLEEHVILALCRIWPFKIADISEFVSPPLPSSSPGVSSTPPTSNSSASNETAPPSPASNETATPSKKGIYAVFELAVSEASPIITNLRKTKRKLACTLKPFETSSNSFEFYEPTIIRSPKSLNIFIIGCDTLIYYSINGGQTFWNTIFYRRYATGEMKRFHQDEEINKPLVAFDPDGHSVIFCSGDWYAFGQINYNREFRLVMDRISMTEGTLVDLGRCRNTMETSGNCTACLNTVSEPPACIQVISRCEVMDASNEAVCGEYWDTVINFATYTKFLPYYSNNAQLSFAFVAMHILQQNQRDTRYRRWYHSRNAIRLIDFPVHVSNAVRPFFSENLAILPQDKWKAFGPCSTFGYILKPKFVSFDLDEQVKAEVQVEDLNRNLPLGIFSAQNTALQFNVKRTNKSVGSPRQLARHNWEITITAVGKRKNRIQRRSDAFFGSEYTRFIPLSTFAAITTFPQIRCHVQSNGLLYIDISCAGKFLVAHEDYNRPQCGTFFDNFEFEYKKGEYDPDLIEFWLMTLPNHYRMEGTTVKVRYNFETFGCPLLPYRLDDVVPDMRIVDSDLSSNLSDSMIGLKYNNSYVLIEIHGARGFTYTKSTRQANCVRPPQTFKQMLAEWKIRKKVIQEGFRGYRGFSPKDIFGPQNIWNRINYQPCELQGNFAGEMTDEILNAPYEILQRGSDNSLRWTSERTRNLYIFAAFEVDPKGTFCDFRTFFAINVKGSEESLDFISILRFFFFFLICLLFVFGGFFIYRSHLRRMYRKTALFGRLERAAWQILFRFERFIHEIKTKMATDNEEEVWERVEQADVDEAMIEKVKPHSKSGPTPVGRKKQMKADLKPSATTDGRKLSATKPVQKPLATKEKPVDKGALTTKK